jgi:hypothetical protein
MAEDFTFEKAKFFIIFKKKTLNILIKKKFEFFFLS